MVKAGFAGDHVPKHIFPNFVGRPKHVRVMAGALEGDVFLGENPLPAYLCSRTPPSRIECDPVNQTRTQNMFEIRPLYIWVCQYAKGFLIRWSSSEIVRTLILRYLPFFFFQISFIFRFFLNPHLAANLYIVVQLVLHLDY